MLICYILCQEDGTAVQVPEETGAQQLNSCCKCSDGKVPRSAAWHKYITYEYFI